MFRFFSKGGAVLFTFDPLTNKESRAGWELAFTSHFLLLLAGEGASQRLLSLILALICNAGMNARL